MAMEADFSVRLKSGAEGAADARGAIRAVSTAAWGVSTLGLGAFTGPHGVAAPPGAQGLHLSAHQVE